jgi:hypothetical protein
MADQPIQGTGERRELVAEEPALLAILSEAPVDTLGQTFDRQTRGVDLAAGVAQARAVAYAPDHLGQRFGKKRCGAE